MGPKKLQNPLVWIDLEMTGEHGRALRFHASLDNSAEALYRTAASPKGPPAFKRTGLLRVGNLDFVHAIMYRYAHVIKRYDSYHLPGIHACGTAELRDFPSECPLNSNLSLMCAGLDVQCDTIIEIACIVTDGDIKEVHEVCFLVPVDKGR